MIRAGIVRADGVDITGGRGRLLASWLACWSLIVEGTGLSMNSPSVLADYLYTYTRCGRMRLSDARNGAVCGFINE